MANKLLTRSQFKDEVFRRDNHKCLVCKAPAVDAHHIIERKLFKDGGYYIENGVSVCEVHHLMAEQTLISCEELRKLAKIKNVILPAGFEMSSNYDKWGNQIVSSDKRLPGPLFFEDSVQKVLSSVDLLKLFD